MRVLSYLVRKDEIEYFDMWKDLLQMEVEYSSEDMTLETASKAKGFDAVSCVASSDLSEKTLKKLAEYGVKVISLRTIGYDNIDLKAASELGLRVSNVRYSPYSVANFTVMLMLMCIRKAKHILLKMQAANYGFDHLNGKEMQNLTVGVIGAGVIGKAVLQNLSGFGCKRVVYDMEEVQIPGVEQVSLEDLLRISDVITIHLPLNSHTFHLFDEKTFHQMKEGVIIINTARGEIVDSKALIRGIRSGKVAAAGLDCCENELSFYHANLGYYNQNLSEEYAVLNSMQNVIMTPHVAFFTDQATSDMIKGSLENIRLMLSGKECIQELSI